MTDCPNCGSNNPKISKLVADRSIYGTYWTSCKNKWHEQTKLAPSAYNLGWNAAIDAILIKLWRRLPSWMNQEISSLRKNK